MDGSFRKLTEGGLAFGILEDATYDQSEIYLLLGDRLLLYTDGAIDAMSAEGFEFGEDHLLQLLIENRTLGAVELQKILMEAVTDFSGGQLYGDVTMIVIAVT